MQSLTRNNILNLYKNLLKNIKLPDGKTTNKSLEEILKNQFKQNKVTSDKYCRQQNELYFVAQTYLAYLENLKEFNEIKAKYHKGERTTEQAANLVGLKLPKQFQE